MFRTAQSFGELAAVWVFVALAPWAVAHAQSGGREVRANPPTGAPIERTFRGTPLACGPLAIEVRDGEVAPPRPRVLGWAAACEAERGSVPRARVARLAEVEGRLREARAALARLDEAAALRTLAEGIRLAEELADVPGTAGWLAELELQLGLAAAQSGLDAVARDAFRRAVGFDPERRVEAAEAPPSVLEMAEAISRARRTTPYGSFDVTSSAPGARVFVDDVDAGLLPARVRVPVGRHLLRVEAPLHVTFGTVIDVFEGDRAPIAVPLAESLDVGAVDALLEAAANARFGGMVEASMDLGRSAGLDVAVRTIETHGSRAIVTECDASGCAPTTHSTAADAHDLPSRDARRDPGAITGAYAAHRAWLADTPEARRAARPWYERWELWVTTAVVVVTGAVAIGLGISDEPKEQRSLVLEIPDPGAEATSATH